MRNDPDGRSRLNVNVFTGNVIVTDFGDENGTISNIQKDKLTDVFDQWLNSELAQSLNCHCPEFQCLGPNVLVKICTILKQTSNSKKRNAFTPHFFK